MFGRLTERSRNVLVAAQEEAVFLNHGYIGTEHILLGLLRDEDAVAPRALHAWDVTLEAARAEVVRIVGVGTDAVGGEVPFTPRVKKVIQLARDEARELRHDCIATEHILLGLVRENEGVGARVLHDRGADAGRIRAEILRILSGSRDPEPGMRSQVTIGCPGCGHRLETVTAERPGATFEVSGEGERACAGCGRRWTISYAVSCREASG